MGFSYRKSVSFGPVRFTLSKSGVSTSVGVHGFRVGSGPRGAYVHIGAGGLYYRQTLGPFAASTAPMPLSDPSWASAADQGVMVRRYSTTDLADLSAADPDDLIRELNEKAQALPLVPAVVLCLLLVVVPGFAASAGEMPWLYGMRGVFVGAVALGGTGFMLWSIRSFLENRTIVILYDLEADAESVYNSLFQAFAPLGECQKGWSILTRQHISDWKRNAGAGASLERKTLRLDVRDPPRIRTNISVPAILTSGKSLYFLPDRLLVEQNGRYASVGYETVRVDVSTDRFIEERPPSDATIVDYTWQYVNKDGGPDRRFSNNRQIPVCSYTNIHISTPSGLDERFMFSRSRLRLSLQSVLTSVARVVAQPTTAGHSASTELVPDEIGGGREILTVFRTPAAWVAAGAVVGAGVGAWAEAGGNVPPDHVARVVSSEAASDDAVRTVQLAWERSGLRIRVEPSGRYELGLAETGAAKGMGWMRESCGEEGRFCHLVDGGDLRLRSTRDAAGVKQGVTLFGRGHRGQLSILLRDGSRCWAGGDDPSYYQSLGCGPLIVREP